MHTTVLDDLDDPLDDEINVDDNQRSWPSLHDVQPDGNSIDNGGKNILHILCKN